MFDSLKDVLSVDEACKALGIGKNKMYELLNKNIIMSIRVGKKYCIPKEFLIDFVNSFRYNNI